MSGSSSTTRILGAADAADVFKLDLAWRDRTPSREHACYPNFDLTLNPTMSVHNVGRKATHATQPTRAGDPVRERSDVSEDHPRSR